MTLKEVMDELEAMGSEQTKNIFIKHGAQEPLYGVKVQDLKKIVKRIKKDHDLSLQLYNTGNADAMYLAGLLADKNRISKAELNAWVKAAKWHMISEYTVPWVAAETKYGWDLALKWIDSKETHIASAGWATLSSLVGYLPDDQLDIKKLEELMERAAINVHKDENRVSYTMNGFLIAVGSGVGELTSKAEKYGLQVGKVKVNMGDTACKVPEVSVYIKTVKEKGKIGKKRTNTRC